MRIVLFCNESSLPAHLAAFRDGIVGVVLSPGRALPDPARALIPPALPVIPYPHNHAPDPRAVRPGEPGAAGRADFAARLRALSADLFVVHGFNRILPRELFSLPPRGAVNLHGGPLPAMRGAHVVNWAVALGMRATAVTLHEVVERVDAGPVFAATELAIGAEEDARSLRDRLIVAGVELLAAHLPALLAGTARAVPQDEANARHFPRRTETDGWIDWRAPARAVFNLVRALPDPWPGAHFALHGEHAVIRRARLIAEAGGPGPGVVVTSAGGTVAIGCGRGMIAPLATVWRGSPVAPEDLFAGVSSLPLPPPAQIADKVLHFNQVKGRFS